MSIDPEACQYLADIFRNNTVYYNLSLSRRFAVFIVFVLQKMVEVDLSMNSIGNEGMKYLANGLRENTVNFVCVFIVLYSVHIVNYYI